MALRSSFEKMELERRIKSTKYMDSCKKVLFNTSAGEGQQMTIEE